MADGFEWQVGVWDTMADIYQREIDSRFGPVIDHVLARADLQPGEPAPLPFPIFDSRKVVAKPFLLRIRVSMPYLHR